MVKQRHVALHGVASLNAVLQEARVALHHAQTYSYVTFENVALDHRQMNAHMSADSDGQVA